MSDLASRIVEKVQQRIALEAKPVVANISNRHFHCTQEHFEILFGNGKKPTRMRDLVQPGQFACNETVSLKGPKGELKNVRMIGPCRAYSQAEVSRTDTFTLGLNPPARDSGNLKGTAPVTFVGPAGRVDLREGCIIALRHLHMSVEDAKQYGLQNGQTVRVRAAGSSDSGRSVVFENVLCRVSKDMRLECHLDTDEANACGLKNGDLVVVLP